MVKRKIEQKMFDFIDNKLAENGYAQDAIERKDARSLLVEAAKACVGIREKTGRNDGPMVELIQETVGGHSNEAWCMAFVMTCIAYVEKKLGIESRIKATESCADLWSSATDEQKVKFLPRPGAIIIWGHYNSQGKYTGGHTGHVVEINQDDGTMIAIEGNTTGGVSENDKVIREGGGCYRTKRSLKGNGDMIVRGFIKPF